MFMLPVLGSLFVALAVGVRASAHFSCEELDVIFQNSTYLPSRSGYEALATDNWSQTAWGSPTCIVTPGSASQLALLVNVLVVNHVQFAIRSGGHSPNPGFANINNGVLIDMSLFNQVHYDASQNVVLVGSGLTWGTVYTTLEQYNVTVVGGRVLDVGVGGLMLGGGLSYLSDKYGLACDNVVNFEVVLADGTVVNANNDEHSDLFWALKGGSNNFGIVTTFTLVTYPLPVVWGGIKGYNNSQLPALLDALADYQANYQNDSNSNLMIQSAVTNNSVGSIINIVYLEPVESPEAFTPFYDIPTTFDTTTIQSWVDFLGGQILSTIPRWGWRSTVYTPNAALYQQVLAQTENVTQLSALEAVTSGTLTLGFQPISPSLVNAGIARGGNALGLSAVSQTWMVLDFGWWASDQDAAAAIPVQQIVEYIEDDTKAAGAYLEYQFMNDANFEQDVIAHYGEANVERLLKVQEVYDPSHVFQNLVPGGFKLPASA